jgi:hypothetical protein
MNISEALEESISSVDRQRRAVTKRESRQVTASDERTVLKATALSWFNNHRPVLAPLEEDSLLKAIDMAFKQLLEYTDKATSRTRYKEHLKSLKSDLVKFRSQAVMLVNTGNLATGTRDTPPSFDGLVSDSEMIAILERRWTEAQICRDSNAPLAAIVMMGSLLEALLLARANQLADMSRLFQATLAPVDKKAGKVKKLQEWTLRNFLDVAHELGWIRRSAKDVGATLRDYRNYIHPEKERKHGMVLTEQDARMFWAVFRELAEQVVASA